MGTEAVKDTPTATLGEPLALPCGATLRNRLVKAAMSEQLGSRGNDTTRSLVRLYERWAGSGCGLLITGNVMVDRRHVGEPRNVIVEDDRDLGGLARWAEAAKSRGASVWMQINHPGRQALRIAGSRPVAPSAVAMRIPGAVTPRELTADEIRDVIARYATVAGIAKSAGFDGVQIHGAHGYLVSQFLSPLANRRDDDWGGDAERRRHFVLELLRAMRAAVGTEFPIGIKLNSADFQRGGFDEEESRAVVVALAAEEIDMIEVSGGTYERPAMMRGTRRPRESTLRREAYFMEYAERMRELVPDTPLMVTGGFRSLAAMEDAVASGACDLIGLGRPVAVAPEGGAELLAGERDRIETTEVTVPVRYLDSAVDLYWYTRQLKRIGAGRDPDPDEPALKTLAALIYENGWNAFRRKRGG